MIYLLKTISKTPHLRLLHREALHQSNKKQKLVKEYGLSEKYVEVGICQSSVLQTSLNGNIILIYGVLL